MICKYYKPIFYSQQNILVVYQMVRLLKCMIYLLTQLLRLFCLKVIYKNRDLNNAAIKMFSLKKKLHFPPEQTDYCHLNIKGVFV